jgi:hypothetical protein
MRKRTPFVFVPLVMVLVFRILRILTIPAETSYEEKMILYFQIGGAVIPLAGLLVCVLLSFRKLEIIKFAASFILVTTLIFHIIFNRSKYHEHATTIQVYGQFAVILFLLIQNIYVLSVCQWPDLVTRVICLLVQV